MCAIHKSIYSKLGILKAFFENISFMYREKTPMKISRALFSFPHNIFRMYFIFLFSEKFAEWNIYIG